MEINKQQVQNSFRKSLHTYHTEASVQAEICDELTQLIKKYVPETNSILEIGCGTGLLSERLLKDFSIAEYHLNDLVSESIEHLKEIFQVRNLNWEFQGGDAEALEFPDNLDLVCSASTIQWFTDLPAFFRKVKASLKPEAYWVFNSFGPDNFKEIKALNGNTLAYKSLEEVVELVSEEFEIVDAFEEKRSLSFESPCDVLLHIKKTGVNGFAKEKWTKSRYLNFIEEYKSRFSTEKGVSLTYHPIYVVAKKVVSI